MIHVPKKAENVKYEFCDLYIAQRCSVETSCGNKSLLLLADISCNEVGLYGKQNVI